MMRFSGFLLCGAAMLSVSSLFAAQTPVDTGTLVVTPTRTETRSSDVLIPLIVINRDQISLMQPIDLADLLRFQAGLDIGRNGGPGQPASVFMRGANSNQTLVLIDGVRINPDTIGGAALQNIRPEDIERVEIIKGPRSALYGSDAIGGVINIITRRGGKGPEYGFSGGGGHYATRTLSGNLSFGTGNNLVGISAGEYRTDGFPTLEGTTKDRGYTNRTVNAYGRTLLGGITVEMRHWQAEGTSEYMGFSPTSFTLSPLDESYANSVSALQFDADPGRNWHSQLLLSHNLDSIDQNQSMDFDQTERNAFDWQNTLDLGEHQQLIAGAYYAREHTSSRVFGLGYDNASTTRALYAEDLLDYQPHRLMLAARRTHDGFFGDHITWSVGYGYDVTPETRLTFNAGTGFRAPNGSERFGFGGNPDLQPETSRDYEIGLRHRLTDFQTVSVNVFQNRIENLITYVDPDGPSGPLPGQNQNLANARIQGLELDYTLMSTHWHWNNQMIWQRPENLDTGNVLPRRSRRSLTSSFIFQEGGYQYGISILATGPRKDSDFSTLTNAGYVLVGISYAYRINRQIKVGLQLDNALDTRYQTAAGFNSMRRALFLTVSYTGR